MELRGSRRHDVGVKVKFIETQFVSSDAASFKSVVQRLTGKSPSSSSAAAAPVGLHWPRPCRAGRWATQQGRTCTATGGNNSAGRQEPHAALAVTAEHLEELHELCDFADLFYAPAGERRDGSNSIAFPY